jgi:hypothetical protein
MAMQCHMLVSVHLLVANEMPTYARKTQAINKYNWYLNPSAKG